MITKNDASELSQLFKNEDGSPLVLTEGQKAIFNAIVLRQPREELNKRWHVMTTTQYGKSLTIALAVNLRSALCKEKWAIVGPSQKKAAIIMTYAIQHMFDTPLLYTQVQYDESIQKLKQERSKQRITWKKGGEILILSADERNKKAAGEALMGFGSPNLIEDESALIGDDTHSKAMRMLGGHRDNFLMKVGNPFRRNHFLKSSVDEKYHKIVIDYIQAVEEGRLTEEFIVEMSKLPNFDIFYEVTFPAPEATDAQGWSTLVNDEELQRQFYHPKTNPIEAFGELRLGVDIARGGGNQNVFMLRSANNARILQRDNEPDLMATAGRIIQFAKEHNILDQNIFIDDVGAGGGVSARLREQGHQINAVNVGERATDDSKFINKRAEFYWAMRQWLVGGGKLEVDDIWWQLCDIKYKPDSSGRMKIMSKEDMSRLGIESPDVADALMLTFARPDRIVAKDPAIKRIEREYDSYRQKQRAKGGMMTGSGYLRRRSK